MIRRHYFYQIDSEANSENMFGVIEIKSWRADPWKALITAKEHAAKYMATDITHMKVVTFNRV